ncbi:MAG: integrase core domain-containing protein [Nitrospirales bacterium]
MIERFIRSMKNECTRRILVPLALEAMRRELTVYLAWFNEHRPSQALGGKTPNEMYTGQRPANATFRFEPRTMWPRRSSCAAPQAQIKGRRGAKLTLVVGYLEGRKHLPVVELRRAA